MLATAATHLANAPHGAITFVLIVAALCFFAGAVVAFVTRAFWAIAVSAGLALFVLAFLVT